MYVLFLSQVYLILEDGYSLSYKVENNRNLSTWPQGEDVFSSIQHVISSANVQHQNM